MEEIYMERKYRPEDYETQLCKDMLRAYDLFEKDRQNDLYGAVIDVYYGIKEAVKFREIDPVAGQDMQRYFWRMIK